MHPRLEQTQLQVHGARVELKLVRRREVSQRALERHGARDEGRIVQREGGELLARLDERASHLGQVHLARLPRREHEEHLHHLHLRERLAALEVRAVLDHVPRQLPRVRRHEH